MREVLAWFFFSFLSFLSFFLSVCLSLFFLLSLLLHIYHSLHVMYLLLYFLPALPLVGSGLNFMSACIVVEEIAKVDPSVAVLVDIQNTLINNMLR